MKSGREVHLTSRPLLSVVMSNQEIPTDLIPEIIFATQPIEPCCLYHDLLAAPFIAFTSQFRCPVG
jgi:hypothetical protein